MPKYTCHRLFWMSWQTDNTHFPKPKSVFTSQFTLWLTFLESLYYFSNHILTLLGHCTAARWGDLHSRYTGCICRTDILQQIQCGRCRQCNRPFMAATACIPVLFFFMLSLGPCVNRRLDVDTASPYCACRLEAIQHIKSQAILILPTLVSYSSQHFSIL